MIKKKTLVAICSLISLNLLSQSTIKRIKPSETDSLITTFNSDSHYVYLNTSVPSKNILLVHLPGSFGEPKRATLFGTLAANLGFHSIGLMYPNAPTVGSFCTNSADADCFEDVRREIVEGVDYSSEISISLHESILNRTKKLLIYLETNYPNENWGQYLDSNNNLEFSKLIFSGHSQGGGHAAIIAKYYPIKRAICISSPKDWRNIPDAPPTWLSNGNWKTSSNSIYCFNHILDEHTNHQLEIWNQLGLNTFGPPVNVDSFSSPYQYTRQLTTSFSVPNGDEHACTIQDKKTPKLAGIPVFIPIWTYMLTDPMTTHVASNIISSDDDMHLYPNPSNDKLVIELKEKIQWVRIFDQTGKCELEHFSNKEKTEINLTDLNAGIYLIQVCGVDKTFRRKLIKSN